MQILQKCIIARHRRLQKGIYKKNRLSQNQHFNYFRWFNILKIVEITIIKLWENRGLRSSEPPSCYKKLSQKISSFWILVHVIVSHFITVITFKATWMINCSNINALKIKLLAERSKMLTKTTLTLLVWRFISYKYNKYLWYVLMCNCALREELSNTEEKKSFGDSSYDFEKKIWISNGKCL